MSRLADIVTKVGNGDGVTGGVIPPHWRHRPDPTDKDAVFGDWMRLAWRNDQETLWKRYQTKAALAEGAGGTVGGYLVPVHMAAAALTEAAEHSFFLQLGTQVPLTTRETNVPHASVTGGAAGISPFYGGAVFSWQPGQGAALNETEPTFFTTSLTSHTLAGYALISNQMLEDVEDGPLGKYLRELLGRAAAWYFDLACFRGDGVGKPLGLINSPGALSVSRTAGGDVQVADLANMAAKLIPAGSGAFDGPTACWAIHPSVQAKLFALASWQIGQPPGAGKVDEPGAYYLNGSPIYVTEKLSNLGTRGDVALFVPKLFLVGIRQEVEIMITREEPTAFTKNQSVIRVTFRADGRLRLNSSVVLADGAATAAAAVVLN
jgi:HK97 family phage major capsid protein